MASELQDNLIQIEEKLTIMKTYVDGILNHTTVLPYIPLEYIQSNGEQYINTGYIPNITTSFEIKINTTKNNQGWDCVMVSTNGDMGSTAFGIRLYNQSANYDLNYGTRSTSTSVTPVSSGKAFNTIYTITGSNNTMTFAEDSTSYSGSTRTMSTATLPVYLFGGNSDGSLWRPYFGKIYYCKLYDNGTLVRHFIPVKRKSDDTVCMYDLVEKKFYTNAGTGNFIAGPEEQ